MKPHLTERQLIEYQFNLASQADVEQIAAHLEQCSDCRRRAEQLKRKFAALDLLRGEIEVPEDLITRTAAEADKPVRTGIVPFWKRTTFAAAAVFLIALGLLITDSIKDERRGPQRSDQLGSDREEPTDDTWKFRERAVSVGGTDLGVVIEPGGGEPISEKAPFAPASAIELVTLPRRENVQITIYNSADLTLVRERRNLTLKRGWNWLQFMWANTLIDPTSLNLEPLAQADKIDIQQLVFPARLSEVGRWLIRSETSGRVPFEITYFTSGLSWRAFYMGTLAEDEKTMRLQGYVRVANSTGEDYENAQTRLLVGKVHLLDKISELAKRRHPYGSPVTRDLSSLGSRFGRAAGSFQWGERAGIAGLGGNGVWARDEFRSLREKEIIKEGLSEYFLYTIEGTETIRDKWAKRLISFDVQDIDVESLYKYDEERWGNRAIRFAKFANDQDHNLGQTPLPNGTVKIYGQADEQGHLSYVGGAEIKYIPVDEEIELNLGPAREVIVEPKLMDEETANYVFDRRGNIAGWDEIRNWKIEMTNTRKLGVELEITRFFDTAYWTIKPGGGGVSYEKHDAERARFKVRLEPRTKQDLVYTVTMYHGLRQEQINE